ncbi:E-selectin-like isoform X1 [Mercenaria mercenaria]|uniref:E-selectin-like isoform X1 n=1 Tax=Mercenaria mercenaria TaxID=6596 RepID=UPI00234F9CC6|nr:E-selectin-like isoform X1 [Mercenaria mercenaria]
MFPTEKCPTDCGDPTPEAGVANPTDIKIGSAVQISCKIGYEIAGNSSIICLVNGSWSDRPECQPTDCMMPNFDSAIIINTSEGTTYNVTAKLSCAVGFTLIGNAYVTCQADGNWSTQPNCVINNCGDPTPESGNVDSTDFQYGSVIEVKCVEGYKINGNSSIICQANSTWNNIPVCDQIECETINITNGHFDTALGTTFGKTATQSCDTGYTLSGDETVTCLEAGWNGTIATCTIVDSVASALVVVYAMVPVIVIVLTLVLLFVIWRKRHIQCAQAKDAKHKSGENPTIQYASETNSGHGLKHQINVSETSESIPPDEEYSFITEHNKVEPTDTMYYNTFDNICKVENDVESQYDHTNDISKSFSDNIYSHISRNKPGIQDGTTYDTTSCQNSGNEALNTKAQTEDDSYSHLNIEGLNKAIHQKPQTTTQDEESEYANTSGNIDAVETEQKDDFNVKEGKMKTKTVEKEVNSHDEDCEYSNVIKRPGSIESTGE